MVAHGRSIPPTWLGMVTIGGLICFCVPATAFAQSTFAADHDEAHPFAHLPQKDVFYPPSGDRTFTTPIQCADLKAEIVSTCSMDSIGIVSCSSQHLHLPSVIVDVGMAGFDMNGWGCTHNTTDFFLIFSYGNMGNCDTCERYELWNLSGRRIADWHGFDTQYGKLGLPANSKDTPDAFGKQIEQVNRGL